MIKEIKNNNMEEANKAKVAVVDFSATWCGPCKMLSPVIEALSEEMSDVEFFGADVDENGELAAQFGVQGVPTVVLLKEGQKVAQNVGFVPKENLQGFIKANM